MVATVIALHPKLPRRHSRVRDRLPKLIKFDDGQWTFVDCLGTPFYYASFNTKRQAVCAWLLWERLVLQLVKADSEAACCDLSQGAYYRDLIKTRYKVDLLYHVQ